MAGRKVAERGRTHRNDDEETSDLDHREQRSQNDGLEDAPGRDHAEYEDQRDDDQPVGRADEALEIAGEATHDRSARHDHRAGHQEPDGQGEPGSAEPLVDVRSLAGALRVTRGQLGEAEGREARHQQRQQKRDRRVEPGASDDAPDQHIDAGADRRAEAVEHHERQRQAAPEGRLGARPGLGGRRTWRWGRRGGFHHQAATGRSETEPRC